MCVIIRLFVPVRMLRAPLSLLRSCLPSLGMFRTVKHRAAASAVGAMIFTAVVFYTAREERTFFIAEGLSVTGNADGVREALLEDGFTEVDKPDRATVLWIDEKLARLHHSNLHGSVGGGRNRWVSTIPGVPSSRAEAGCRLLRSAYRTFADAEIADGAVRACDCVVLPAQADEVRALVEAEGGASYWLLRPADSAERRQAEREAAAGRPPPLLTNNPDALGALGGGTWTARRYVADPLLLGGKRASLELYALVSSVTPLRLHADCPSNPSRAVRWLADRPRSP